MFKRLIVPRGTIENEYGKSVFHVEHIAFI